MKLQSTIITVCLVLLLTRHSPGAPILAQRAKLEGARQETESAAAATPANAELAAVAADKVQALAGFDAAQAAKFGPSWLTRWQNSKHENPDDEAVEIYINERPYLGVPVGISGAGRKQLVAHLAAKPVLVAEDVEAVMIARVHDAALASRIEEFAALLPSRGIRDTGYFRLKHLGLLGRKGNGFSWTQHMTTEDWFDLAAADAPFLPVVFTAMRDHLLAHAARLLIDKRKAAGQPVEGPEFEAAIAPVVAALGAPKFGGLASVVADLGLDLEIPPMDHTAQEKVAAAAESAAAGKTKFTTAWGAQLPHQDGLGSVMFVKGEAAYTAWRDGLLQNR